MLTEEGMNSDRQQHWKLCVPEEHCVTGLEVGIVAKPNGLMIGGEIIKWADLDVARLRALSKEI